MKTAENFIAMIELAVDISRRAAETLEPVDRKIVQTLPRDAKIAADQRLHRLIKAELMKGSSWAVLSEEELDNISIQDVRDPIWILDPLDGSVNFSHNIPLCCISIGLWHGMTPVLGVVHDFERSEIFSGLVGKGAWLNGVPVKVSGINRKSEAILCTGFPSKTDFSDQALSTLISDIRSYKKVRLLGSAALSLAYVASGRVDAYQENDIAVWDVAAGLAIVKASGGSFAFHPTNRQNRFNVKAGVL